MTNARRLGAAVIAGVLVLASAACGDARSPEERELAALQDELKQVEAEIAGMQRVSSASGEAPGGEIEQLKDKQSELNRKISLVKERMQEGGAGQ